VETYGAGGLIPAKGTPERFRYRYWRSAYQRALERGGHYSF
jgi:hypothetical protein